MVSSTWVTNSFAYDPSVSATNEYFSIIYFIVVLSAVVLWHSWYMHGGNNNGNRNIGAKAAPKRPYFTYTSTRLQTELAAAATLFGAICLWVSTSFPNPTKSAVLVDFFFNGLCTATVQLCDNYMFFSRFVSVCKISDGRSRLIHLYIWVLLTLPWSLAFWLIPIFYDTNTPEFQYAFFITVSCTAALNVVFNWYFTGEFVRMLAAIYKPTMWAVGEDLASLQIIRSIAYKSIGHCITSSFAVVLYCFLPIYGPLMQSPILLAGMHFWFNVVLPEDSLIYLCCCAGRTGGRMFRSEFFSEGADSLAPSKKIQLHKGRRVVRITYMLMCRAVFV